MNNWQQKMTTLEAYQSPSSCPKDLTNYWQKALTELEGVEANVELIEVMVGLPDVTCYEVYFTSVGEARIHGRLVLPKKEYDIPGIVKFHGYGHYAGDWFNQMGLTLTGSAVFSIDSRGQGGLSEDTSKPKGTTFNGHLVRGLAESAETLLYRSHFLDTVAAARVLMAVEGVDSRAVSSFGYSQGGGLALACAALEPRIKKVAVAYPFLSDYQGVYQSGSESDAYAEIKKYIKDYDPTHQNLEELFARLSYIDIQHIVDRIQGEVLFAASLSDTTCPPFAQFATYNRLRAEKQLVLYPDFGHEDLPGFMDQVLQFLSL